MTTRSLTMLAIALWLAAVVAVAVFFVQGTTRPSQDQRKAIILSATERDLVLAEMRVMLETVQGITAGLARDDLAAVSTAARRSGATAAADVNPRLMLKLPLVFKELGMGVHRGFDEMAKAAEQGASREALLEHLATQLAACTGCHAGYRFAGPESGP